MRAERQAKVDYLKEIFAIDDSKALLMAKGKAFYNPVTRCIVTKANLLRFNCAYRAQRIRKWIENAENRSSYEPGYDDRIRYYIMFAEITENIIRQHLKFINQVS